MELHGCGARCEDSEASAARVAFAIDQQVDPVVADDRCSVGVGEASHVAPRFAERRADPLVRRAAVVGAVAVGVQIEAAAIGFLEKARHQPTRRVLAKVARQVADAQPLARAASQMAAQRERAAWRVDQRLATASCCAGVSAQLSAT